MITLVLCSRVQIYLNVVMFATHGRAHMHAHVKREEERESR